MISPPLRFLAVVLGGWICLRTALLGSAWWMNQAGSAEAPAASTVPAPAYAEPRPGLADAVPAKVKGVFSVMKPPEGMFSPAPAFRPSSPTGQWQVIPALFDMVPGRPLAASAPPGPTALPIPAQRAGRWSGSGWIFVRQQGSDGLAPGGTLGGSQAGARIGYRLNGDESRPLTLSLRGYAPLDDFKGAEIAAGLDWRPIAGLPAHLLVERRHALGSAGRSAFSITGYGGVSEVSVGAVRIDAYGQAGAVGFRSRDLFADGSVKIGLAIGRLKVGVGAWGAVQPRVSRVDVGPQASVRLPGDLTLAADWRQRVAGDAAPVSGPSLTLSRDF